MQKKGRILVVDDDQDLLAMLASYLRALEYDVETATDGSVALAKYRPGRFDLIISDVIMPDTNGLELLQAICRRDDDVVFIMISGYPDINLAVEAMRSGAYDYILKPFELEDVKMRIVRAFECKMLRQRLRYSRGFSWALLLSIPLWLVLGIALSLLLNR